MSSQALDQMLEFAPRTWPTRMYATIDLYAAGTTALYTAPPNPIGPISGLQPSGFGVLRRDLGDGLQERYDFSGHGGTEPHINYDLLGAKGDFSKRTLGYTHHMDLFEK